MNAEGHSERLYAISQDRQIERNISSRKLEIMFLTSLRYELESEPLTSGTQRVKQVYGL